MDIFFRILFLACLFAMILGFIRPKWVLSWAKKQRRRDVFGFFLCGVMTSISFGIALSSNGSMLNWVIGGVASIAWFIYFGFLVEEQKDGRTKKLSDNMQKEVDFIRNMSGGSSQHIQKNYHSTPTEAHKGAWAVWGKRHRNQEQIVRQKRAWDCELKHFDHANATATVISGGGNSYYTGLTHCSCPDFSNRGKPCKHIYRIAMEVGLIDLPQFEEWEDDYTKRIGNREYDEVQNLGTYTFEIK